MRFFFFALVVACAAACGGGGTTDGGIDAGHDEGVTDGGVDLGADAGSHRVDMGFDAATLGTCTLDAAVDPDAAALPVGDPALASGSLEQDRAFYVLTAIEQTPGTQALVEASTALVGFDAVYQSSLGDAASTCAGDATCLHDHVVLDDVSITDGTSLLLAALGASKVSEVATALRASGLFWRFAASDDATLVTNAIAEAMHDLDAAYGAYAGELGAATTQTAVSAVNAAIPASALLTWWQPLMRVVDAVMIADGRTEPTRYEPLAAGENAAAIAAVATTDFSHFAYAAIVVPGQGPTDTVTMLDPAGRMRADLGAQRFMAGVAPFVLLSGGHVHPDRTTFSEAIEMKHYLMSTYAIPEAAIFVDPYARHTTTNLRNATRVLLRAGLPRDAAVLVVSDLVQTAYIRGDAFAMRCDDELHFRPWRGLSALDTTTDTCLALEPLSLTADAADPLDP